MNVLCKNRILYLALFISPRKLFPNLTLYHLVFFFKSTWFNFSNLGKTFKNSNVLLEWLIKRNFSILIIISPSIIILTYYRNYVNILVMWEKVWIINTFFVLTEVNNWFFSLSLFAWYQWSGCLLSRREKLRNQKVKHAKQNDKDEENARFCSMLNCKNTRAWSITRIILMRNNKKAREHSKKWLVT